MLVLNVFCITMGIIFFHRRKICLEKEKVTSKEH